MSSFFVNVLSKIKTDGKQLKCANVFSLLVLNVKVGLNLVLKDEYFVGMHLLKSGKNVRKWRDFIPLLYAHRGPSLGLKESMLFLEIVYFFSFWGAAKLRLGGARSASFGVLRSPKRRGCAAHGRARAAKPHL
jgi:hypothetical protein